MESRKMLPAQRRNRILELLKQSGSISCKDLSDALAVSVGTIRNDLKTLESSGELSRSHGGALLSGSDTTLAVSKREIINADAKKSIARAALKLVRSGDVIFLDGSSTNIFLAKHIKAAGEAVTVITNASRILNELSECDNVKLICIGGNYRKKNMTYVGKAATNTILENYIASKFFFSCYGVDLDMGLLDSSEAEFDIKRAMAKVSNQRIFLCDSSKFGRMAFLKFMDFSSIDVLVTDKAPGAEWTSLFQRENIQVLISEELR